MVLGGNMVLSERRNVFPIQAFGEDKYQQTHLNGIFNRLVAGGDTGTFRSIAETQAGHAARLRDLAGGLPVATVPLVHGELSGLPALRKADRLLCGQLRLD